MKAVVFLAENRQGKCDRRFAYPLRFYADSDVIIQPYGPVKVHIRMGHVKILLLRQCGEIETSRADLLRQGNIKKP